MLSPSLSRSIFITTYVPLQIVALVGYILVLGAHSLVDLALVIFGLGTFPLLLLLYTLIKPSSLADPHLTLLNMISAITLIWGVLLWAMQFASWVVLPAAALSVVGNLVFTYWFSRTISDGKNNIKIGNILPKFTLFNNAGAAVSHKDLKGQLNMLVFYRGTWCPVCVAQLRAIFQTYQSLSYPEVHIYFITAEQEKPSWQPFSESENLHFLYDRDQEVARKLGISISHGVPLPIQMSGFKAQTMVPSIVLTNRKNQIIFAEVSNNFRVRPNDHDYAQYFAMLANK